jgi:hypothetical protein
VLSTSTVEERWVYYNQVVAHLHPLAVEDALLATLDRGLSIPEYAAFFARLATTRGTG